MSCMNESGAPPTSVQRNSVDAASIPCAQHFIARGRGPSAPYATYDANAHRSGSIAPGNVVVSEIAVLRQGSIEGDILTQHSPSPR